MATAQQAAQAGDGGLRTVATLTRLARSWTKYDPDMAAAQRSKSVEVRAEVVCARMCERAYVRARACVCARAYLRARAYTGDVC